MRLVWVVIPLVLFGIIGMQNVDATQCQQGIIRIQDYEVSSQHIEIGKDILHISGKLVSLTDTSRMFC